MKSHLCILAVITTFLPLLGYSAEKSAFRFQNTQIIITIADATSTINVAKNSAIEKPEDRTIYQGGFGRTEDNKSKGSVLYKFIKETAKGDLYTFTVTRPGSKPETIDYVYSGIADRFYGKDGVTITIQENAG